MINPETERYQVRRDHNVSMQAWAFEVIDTRWAPGIVVAAFKEGVGPAEAMATTLAANFNSESPD